MVGNKTVSAIFVIPLTLTASLPPEGQMGVAYEGLFAMSGGLPPYSVASEKIPAGLSFDSQKIIGYPIAPGRKPFNVKITDQLGVSIQRRFTVRIYPSLQVSTQTLRAGTPGRKYAATLKTVGGKGPFNWSIVSGVLPSGVNLDAATGRISGLPTESGDFELTFKVTDQLGGQAQKTLSLTIR